MSLHAGMAQSWQPLTARDMRRWLSVLLRFFLAGVQDLGKRIHSKGFIGDVTNLSVLVYRSGWQRKRTESNAVLRARAAVNSTCYNI